MVNYFLCAKDQIYIIVSRRKTRAMHPDLLLNDTKLTKVNNHKHLGLEISTNMSWSSHINEILAKVENDSPLCEGQNIFYYEVALLSYKKA